MTRESMTFYADWLKAVQSLPKAMQADVLLAILEYGLNGVDTCSEGSIESAILAFIKPQIDINNQRFENGKKGAEFGKLGGRPRKTPKKPQENPEETPRKPQNNPIGFSTPLSPSSLSPEPPFSTPPISPVISDDVVEAHAIEDDQEVIETENPKEKGCGQKEMPPPGSHIPAERLEGVLLSDERWLTNLAKNKEIKASDLRALIKEFCTRIVLTEDSKEITAAKTHFLNWLNKRNQNGYDQRKNQYLRATRSENYARGSDFSLIDAAIARGIATGSTPQEWEL